MRLRCTLIAFAFVLSTSAFANRGITPEDYFAFQSINDAHISPDGKQVAYVVTVVDQAKNRRNSSIWLVATDGRSAPRRLTADGVNSNSPRWSPDGSRLAFLSTRSTEAATPGAEAPRPQIYILHLDGGEAQVLSHLKNGVSVLQWSPDGKRFVALSRTGPSDQVAASARKSDVRHYKHISYKFNDTGWFDDKRSHIWVIDAATGKDNQITSGEDWNDTDPQWSPDSTRIAFVSDRTGQEFENGHNKDVWVISAEGGPAARISDHAFEDDLPRWSPDGKQIVFAGRTTRRQFPGRMAASISAVPARESSRVRRRHGPSGRLGGVRVEESRRLDLRVDVGREDARPVRSGDDHVLPVRDPEDVDRVAVDERGQPFA